MKSEKPNCWEFMNCGRGPDNLPGKGCEKCPATKSSSLDGLNQGTFAGRACWLVAGTFCNQRAAGTYATKKASCMKCDFYKAVNTNPGQTGLSIENIDIFAFTHTGLTKRVNEDRYLIRQMEDKSLLLAVADGLGGDVGSDYAAEIVKAALVNFSSLTPGKEKEELKRMALELDGIICNRAEKDPLLEGMATTLVCAVLKNDHVHWLNVGDSRLYIFRKDRLIQVTKDQTLAKFLVDEGELTPEQAKNHYSYDILDQCVGYGECCPETANFKVEKGDLLILSTDGLYKMVPKKVVLSILGAPSSIQERTKVLVNAALDFGGKDNITIVMAQINQTLS
jgi:serine/threonine protein phosphatase PrpC